MKNSTDLLVNLRKELDGIDNELLEILVKRFKLIYLIGKHKREKGISVIQTNRIKYVIDRARTFAKKNDLDPEIFEEIYRTIIGLSCDLEEEIH